MLCRKRREEGGLYRLDGEQRGLTGADGGHGATGHRGHGRGHGGVQGGAESVKMLSEQQTVVNNSGGLWCSSSRLTAVFVLHDGYRASARMGACLAGCWS